MRKENNKNTKGFTLLELLTVIAIIGVLVAMATISYTRAQKKSRDARRKQDLKSIQSAMEQCYVVNNYAYPTSCPASGASLTCSSQTIMVKVPTDPIGTGSYVYSTGTCDATQYCYCALMEVEAGNSTVGCNWGGGTDYFCVANLQ